MNKIGAHIIFGSNPEPFLEAALESVSWVDYYCAVNTAPEDSVAQQNEAIFRRVVPREKQRLERLNMGQMDFSRARNVALNLADANDFVLIVDSDDVHYPELEGHIRDCIIRNHDIITAHFWHLIAYKDLWGQEPHREFCFKKIPGHVKFDKSVHEALIHPRSNPVLLPAYHYVHYGYIKPPREIFRRWKLYSEIEGDAHHYDGRNPDDALAGWLEGCQPFWRDHPPTAKEVLKSYPSAPASARAIEAPRNVGLVLLTWNDAKNLETCLKTLKLTRQPFELCVVDNGSTDKSLELVKDFGEEYGIDPYIFVPLGADQHISFGQSLAQALNVGFSSFIDREDIDYIGWIHPDMVFERDTWLECLRHALDTHPDIVKVGAWEMNSPPISEPVNGNSQCYLIRREALKQAGLFNEQFLACGGREDWDHNNRLAKYGKVMIWPDAIIRHNSMGTRSNHNNEDAARQNADIYYGLWGTYDEQITQQEPVV